LDTKDRLCGESRPSGPKFKRDSTVRVSWYDLIGWAKLDKAAPQQIASSELESHSMGLSAENAKHKAEIDEK
jgi:hypothetical protein